VRCLESVAAQTHAHVEHIVIDAGSTDGTVELLRASGVRFVSEPDLGQADAINKGFALASGRYLGWLNADDVLSPEAIERVVAEFAAGPDVGWVYGDCEVHQEGRRVLRLRPPRRLGRRTLDNGNLIAQPGTLIARWALDRVGKVDEAFNLAMDYDLWVRLVDAGIRAAYVPETIAVFEIHDGSKTGSLGLSEFVREEALVLLKSGRPRQAALACGRAAAAAASRNGTIEPARLRVEVERVVREVAERIPALDPRVIASGAYAEAALLELHTSMRGFRHLAHPAAWRYGVTLRRVTSAARAGAPQMLGRVSARAAR
jgi:glycosyltransferase involved in cell wall biosynthesis